MSKFLLGIANLNNLQSIKAISQLYCYYKMDRPFLRLAPFKVEILRFNPLAVLFVDIISDEEAKMIQQIATPRVKHLVFIYKVILTFMYIRY